MADKKSPADGWPVISGDYIVGDPESPVAVTTLASHIEAELSGAAIAGPCKTENLGIEKVVANIISNPNIRFLIFGKRKYNYKPITKDRFFVWWIIIR